MHFQQRQRTLCVQKAWKTPKNLLVLLEFSDGGLRSLQRRRESARYLLVVATSIYIYHTATTSTTTICTLFTTYCSTL